jgi:hypothetical protein
MMKKNTKKVVKVCFEDLDVFLKVAVLAAYCLATYWFITVINKNITRW